MEGHRHASARGALRLWPCRRIKQRQRSLPDRAGQRVEPIHAVQAADVTDSALAIAVGLLDRVTQPPELVGLADHPAPAFVTLLLVGLVRAHWLRRVGKSRKPYL